MKSSEPILLNLVGEIAHKLQQSPPRRDAADVEELHRLIKSGAPLEDTHINDDDGWTAYLCSIRCGLDDVAEILAIAGADTSRRADAELIAAVFNNDVQLARKALNAGAKNQLFCGLFSALGLAAFHGYPEVIEAMIQAGVPVPVDGLMPLGEMDITDWKIDSAEEEKAFARVAELLMAHGASPNINDYEGKPLIEGFPAKYYPNIHRVLSDALARSSGKP